MNGRYRLHLLGAFGLYGPDGGRLAVTSRKGMALVALLAMARSGERARSLLQDQLWGYAGGEQAAASLRRELSNLRRVINLPQRPPLLEATLHHARLDLSLLDVDLRLLEADVTAQRVHPVNGYGELLEGIDLAGEEVFEDWLREQRQMAADLVEQAQHHGWRTRTLGPGSASPPDAPVAYLTPLRIRPSICVLPFAHAAADSDIAEGLTEEIGITLSRWSTLLVVTAGTTFSPAVERSKLCRQLGVRYLLEGSVRRSDDQVRITVRLIDGVVGEQLWAQHFDEKVGAIFDVEERIAAAVAPLIDSSMEKHERRLATRHPVAEVGAHDLYWRANALIRRWERDANTEAIGLAEKVLALEPENAWAASLVALGHAVKLVHGWSADQAATRALVLTCCEAAVARGWDDAYVLGNAAGAMIVAGDLTTAAALIDRALALNPSMPSALFWGGWVDIAGGHPDRGLDRFQSGLRLNPQMSVRPYALSGIGLALIALGRADEAVGPLDEAAAQVPRFAPALMAAALCAALGGQRDKALRLIQRLQEAGGLDAAFVVVRDPRQQAVARIILDPFTAL